MGFKRRFKRVTVRWRDSSQYSGWQDDGYPRPVIVCETTGYLVRESETCVEIAGSLAEHNIGEVTVFPRACIVGWSR